MIEKLFDVALSFAGEDREYVEKIAAKLKELGIDVFYDNYFQSELWGQDLYQYLNNLYKNKAIFTIIFISKFYKEKLWAKHELKSAQTRAFSENYEYILPVRFDNTDLPGINETTGYLDLSKLSTDDFVELIIKKLMDSFYFDKTKLKRKIFSSIDISDPWNESTVYFDYEFKGAFPDINYGITTFTDKKIIHNRLSVLLHNPHPKEHFDLFWWFRGTQAHAIFKFRVLDDNICLLNRDELNIKSMYVFNSGTYWQSFVYLVMDPQEPIGINKYSEEELNSQLKINGYAIENYAKFKGKIITGQEYDNASCVIDGLVHPIGIGESELRFRYLSPYCFFIAPKASPINHSSPDVMKYVEYFCRNNLTNKISIDEFVEQYKRIPRIDNRYS